MGDASGMETPTSEQVIEILRVTMGSKRLFLYAETAYPKLREDASFDEFTQWQIEINEYQTSVREYTVNDLLDGKPMPNGTIGNLLFGNLLSGMKGLM